MFRQFPQRASSVFPSFSQQSSASGPLYQRHIRLQVYLRLVFFSGFRGCMSWFPAEVSALGLDVREKGRGGDRRFTESTEGELPAGGMPKQLK